MMSYLESRSQFAHLLHNFHGTMMKINTLNVVQFITFMSEFGRGQHRYTLLGRSIRKVYMDAGQPLYAVV